MKPAFWTPLVLSLALVCGWSVRNVAATGAPGRMPPAASFGNANDLRKNTDWKQVFNQLFYWNIGQYPRCDQFTPNRLRANAMYFNDMNFNAIYEAIVKNADGGKSVSNMLDAREKLMGMDSRSAGDVTSKDSLSSIASLKLANGASDFASYLMGREQKIHDRSTKVQNWKTNFFETEEGQTVMKALSGVTIVVVPGFGSHTIPYYTYAEIVKDANRYYCRSTKVNDKGQPDPAGKAQPIRVVGESETGEPTYGDGQTPGEFYALRSDCLDKDGKAKQLGFDVVHPMGRELGNTMGRDDQAADHLASFVNSLPAEYANKKLIFLGYSKGTPVTHNMLVRRNDDGTDFKYTDIRKRTLAIITLAGVNQGAITAEGPISSLREGLGTPDPNKCPGIVPTHPDHYTMEETVACVNAQSDLSLKTAFAGKDKAIATIFALAAKQGDLTADQSKDQLNSALADPLSKIQLKQAEVKEDLRGVLDMTNYERIKWNLGTLSDASDQDSDLSVLSLSVMTRQSDWWDPEESLSPVYVDSGDQAILDIRKFSLDNLFLFSTSLSGFSGSPSGLFDTQVAWVDTKPMALDNRPIAASLAHLTPDHKVDSNEVTDILPEINAIRARNHLDPIPETFDVGGKPVSWAEIPRSQLFASVMKGKTSHLNFVDLGDLRGTHWDISFEQVYRFSQIPGAPINESVADQNPEKSCAANPDGYKGYEHIFPRKAMLASLFETLALYIGAGNQ